MHTNLTIFIKQSEYQFHHMVWELHPCHCGCYMLQGLCKKKRKSPYIQKNKGQARPNCMYKAFELLKQTCYVKLLYKEHVIYW